MNIVMTIHATIQRKVIILVTLAIATGCSIYNQQIFALIIIMDGG